MMSPQRSYMDKYFLLYFIGKLSCYSSVWRYWIPEVLGILFLWIPRVHTLLFHIVRGFWGSRKRLIPVVLVWRLYINTVVK